MGAAGTADLTTPGRLKPPWPRCRSCAWKLSNGRTTWAVSSSCPG